MTPEIRLIMEAERRSNANGLQHRNAPLSLSSYRWLKIMVMFGVLAFMLIAASGAVDNQTTNISLPAPTGDLSARTMTTALPSVSNVESIYVAR